MLSSYGILTIRKCSCTQTTTFANIEYDDEVLAYHNYSRKFAEDSMKIDIWLDYRESKAIKHIKM